ncbi:MAG TPA: crossover junction endodeoxyribonuclease RuvC [Chromatiales bacterium]|nr:crossover junction endodeoxyribonuclease RuvC [Chromatiales bacterium]
MTRILGIDPGSRATGYGIVDADGPAMAHVASGVIRPAGASLPRRVAAIFRALGEVVAEHAPDEAAVEAVFVHRNAEAALKLGQARGAALCALLEAGLEVAEYNPREVKLALVGNGAAGKAQVQHMVRTLLALERAPEADAADALALAICHHHTRATLARLPAGARRGRRRGRGWR